MRFSILVVVLLLSVIPSLANDSNASMTDYQRVLPNNGILYRRDYRQLIGAVNIYDAPNGNIIRSRPEGSYFVSVNQVQDDWAEINEGEWVQSSQLFAAPVSRLGGILLDENTSYPLAMLHENATVFSTDGRNTATILAEYSLVQVLSDASFEGEPIAEVGQGEWIRLNSLRFIRPIERPAEIQSQRWVSVNIAQQTLVAYDGDTPVFATLVSTGNELTPTSIGVFSSYARFNPRDMSRGNQNDIWFYHMEDVPYTFYFDGNHALHGAYWHDNFGNRQSHGCINLSLTDAYWLYSFFSENLDVSDPNAVWPQVYIYNQ